MVWECEANRLPRTEMLNDIKQELRTLHDEILTTLHDDATEATKILLSDAHVPYSQTEWARMQSKTITHLQKLYKNALSPYTDATKTSPMKRRQTGCESR